jgi:putative transposase
MQLLGVNRAEERTVKKSRFSECQIVCFLKKAETEAGVPVAELCRREGVSSLTFCRWKAKYGGWK